MSEYELGKWDLSELAKNPKSPSFKKQIKDLEKTVVAFKKFYNGWERFRTQMGI